MILIGSIAQLRGYVTFSGDIEYENLRPALRSAQQLLGSYVGPLLLEQLSTSTPSADQTALLPYVLAPIANLTLLKYVRSGNVRITDLGVLRTKTADTNDAFEWQVEKVEQHLQSEAFDGIEQLLGYLAANIDKFAAYRDSDLYQAEKSKLIRSASVFSQYYQINSSRLILATLSASMRTEERKVRSMLGDGLTALLGATLSDIQADRLDAARRALVYLTVARALRERLVSITPDGVQVSGISQFGTLRYKDPASDKQLATSIAYFDQEAAQFLTDLASSLKEPVATPAAPIDPVRGDKIVSF